MKNFRAAVLGCSAGGIKTLGKILPQIPRRFPLPLILVQHITPDKPSHLAEYYASVSNLEVREAEEKETIVPGILYIAPPNYHLLLEEDLSLSLTTCPKISYSRPSIDVLFETASRALGPALLAVLLSGSNRDGTRGVTEILKRGGTVIVEDPATALYPEMPRICLKENEVQHIISAGKIGEKLSFLTGVQS